jgi:hypothetical protein
VKQRTKTGSAFSNQWECLKCIGHGLAVLWPLHSKHCHWWKKAESVRVRFTVCLRDQWSMWMQDGCKVYMDSYMASNGSRLMVPWIIFRNHLLEVGLTQKLGDHDTPNTHNRWFILLYHAWGHAWIKIHWNSIWLRAQSHMASHYTCGSTTTLHDIGGVLGRPLDTFSWALTLLWSRAAVSIWSPGSTVIPYNCSLLWLSPAHSNDDMTHA